MDLARNSVHCELTALTAIVMHCDCDVRNGTAARVCSLCHEPRDGAMTAAVGEGLDALRLGSFSSPHPGGTTTKTTTTTTTTVGPNGTKLVTTLTTTVVTKRVPVERAIAVAGANGAAKRRGGTPVSVSAAAAAAPSVARSASPALFPSLTPPTLGLSNRHLVASASTSALPALRGDSQAAGPAVQSRSRRVVKRPSLAASLPGASSAAPLAGRSTAADALSSGSWRCPSCQKATNTAETLRCTVCAALSPLVDRDALHSSAPPVPPQPSAARVPRGQRAEPRPLADLSSPSSAAWNAAAPVPAVPASPCAPALLLDPYGTFTPESEAQWAGVLAACAATPGRPLCDPDFPACDASLYGSAAPTATSASAPATRASGLKKKASSSSFHPPPSPAAAASAGRWGPIEWLPATDATVPLEAHERPAAASAANQDDWCLLPFDADGSADISPSDIKQGRLGLFSHRTFFFFCVTASQSARRVFFARLCVLAHRCRFLWGRLALLAPLPLCSRAVLTPLPCLCPPSFSQATAGSCLR